MILYDDKTKDAIKAENQLIFPNINESDDITFKASYIISGDLHCTKKIFALFDLFVWVGAVYQGRLLFRMIFGLRTFKQNL
mgnify:CR=1 FL=1